MPLTNLEKVNEVQEIADEICTPWEIDFLESIREQLLEGRTLSKKPGGQEEILDGIYQKAVDSPH